MSRLRVELVPCSPGDPPASVELFIADCTEHSGGEATIQAKEALPAGSQYFTETQVGRLHLTVVFCRRLDSRVVQQDGGSLYQVRVAYERISSKEKKAG